VTDDSGCNRFQDELDRLFEGEASDTDTLRLKEHAESCPDCAMLLKMRAHLEGASLSELEAAVPDRLVDGMWPRVELEIMRDDWRRAAEKPRRAVWRWVAVAQAAAIVLLAAGAAFLFGDLNQLRVRELTLTEQVAVQKEQLDALEWRTAQSITRPAAVAAGGAWYRRLGQAGDVTVAEMTRYLEKLPADTQILDARETRRMLAQLPGAVPGARPEKLSGIKADDGLQVGEALRMITALDLERSQRFPAGLIRKLSKQFD
jgi:hypothetical protein